MYSLKQHSVIAAFTSAEPNLKLPATVKSKHVILYKEHEVTNNCIIRCKQVAQVWTL